MDRTAVLYLIAETWTVDDYGIMRPTHYKRQVYCQVNSVTGAEWFEGSRQGLNPEYRLIMTADDYNNEKLAELNGLPLSIYRAYKGRNNTVELYAEWKKGDEQRNYTP